MASGSAACAQNADGGGLTLSGPWDMIAFESKSWGRTLTSWRLLADGSGSWTEFIEAPGEQRPREVAVWHSVAAGAAGFDRVLALLAPMRLPAPDAGRCARFMPDLAYGTLRLTRGATTLEVAWNSGCMDADYVAFMALLRAVDTQVAKWGRAGQVLRQEAVLPPR